MPPEMGEEHVIHRQIYRPDWEQKGCNEHGTNSSEESSVQTTDLCTRVLYLGRKRKLQRANSTPYQALHFVMHLLEQNYSLVR